MITIRRMEIDDLPQVMVIEKENFSVPWTENGFFTYLIRSDAMFLAALEDNQVLGYCGIIMVPDEGDITNVSVSKDAQGRGIGQMLVDTLIKEAKKEGVLKIYLEVRVSNDAAIHVYEKFGFKKEGIRLGYYEEPKEDALVMSYKDPSCKY